MFKLSCGYSNKNKQARIHWEAGHKMHKILFKKIMLDQKNILGYMSNYSV